MEGFLEANRIVEVSLTKLKSIHKSGDLPLRRTLLVSKILNKAQEVATSAHLSFIRSPPSNLTSSSKLLASINQDNEILTSNETSVGPLRPVRTLWRQTSPIASAAFARQEHNIVAEEPMDCVNSVLNNVLCETMTTHSKESSARSLLSSDTKKLRKTPSFANTQNEPWSTWQCNLSSMRNSWNDQSSQDSDSSIKSPGKRNHKVAFPSSDKENFLPWDKVWSEEPKRFKPSTVEGCQLEALPGFDGYLSPRNLQSAPLLTYMLGSAFSQQSSSSDNGWPQTDRDCDQIENHFSFSHSPQYQPILAC